ncbi:hypothetical protein GCM10010156_20270 [Planobispora rosea]|nr:hypothetical protein GCM10010156_20270 [Planobispora rosea]
MVSPVISASAARVTGPLRRISERTTPRLRARIESCRTACVMEPRVVIEPTVVELTVVEPGAIGPGVMEPPAEPGGAARYPTP